jgi:hypothetical protein
MKEPETGSEKRVADRITRWRKALLRRDGWDDVSRASTGAFKISAHRLSLLASKMLSI